MVGVSLSAYLMGLIDAEVALILIHVFHLFHPGMVAERASL